MERKINKDKEFLIRIKTKQEKLSLIKQEIEKLSSYEIPQFISFKIDEISPQYKQYLEDNL